MTSCTPHAVSVLKPDGGGIWNVEGWMMVPKMNAGERRKVIVLFNPGPTRHGLCMPFTGVIVVIKSVGAAIYYALHAPVIFFVKVFQGKPVEAVKAAGKSLWFAIKAPFYGVAIFFAKVYSYFQPISAKHLSLMLEYNMWEGVPLNRGIILVQLGWQVQKGARLCRRGEKLERLRSMKLLACIQ